MQFSGFAFKTAQRVHFYVCTGAVFVHGEIFAGFFHHFFFSQIK